MIFLPYRQKIRANFYRRASRSTATSRCAFTSGISFIPISIAPCFRSSSDDVGEHDLLHPCCRKEMYDFFYQNGNGHPNCLDNINRALNERRPIVHPLNLFMHTKINGDGSITVARPLSKPGDTIVLKARMNLRLGVAACSVSESDCNGGKCTPVKIIVED